MKNYVLWIAILIMSYTGISQDLEPKVLLVKNKKHFCFTIPQSKEIAKLLELGVYNDSLVTGLSTANWRFQLLIHKKDSVNSFQKMQLTNYTQLLDNKEQTIDLMVQTIKRKDRKIKRSKLHKILLTGSVIVIGTLLISK